MPSYSLHLYPSEILCKINLMMLCTIPTWGLSVWSLHVLPVYVWVLSGYSGFLPPSKIMHVRLIGGSKLSLGVSVSVCGCLSRLSLCGPVMDSRPVQGVPRLSPNDRWDRLQPPRDPTDGLDGIENGQMDVMYHRWGKYANTSQSFFEEHCFSLF